MTIAVEQAVAESMATPDTQARIEQRLREERTALEQKVLSSSFSCCCGCVRQLSCRHALQVERQLENEKAALLERKRREQAEQRRKQAELERILEENRRKVHISCSAVCMLLTPLTRTSHRWTPHTRPLPATGNELRPGASCVMHLLPSSASSRADLACRAARWCLKGKHMQRPRACSRWGYAWSTTEPVRQAVHSIAVTLSCPLASQTALRQSAGMQGACDRQSGCTSQAPAHVSRAGPAWSRLFPRCPLWKVLPRVIAQGGQQCTSQHRAAEHQP